MKRVLTALAGLLALILVVPQMAHAFCGFYVAGGDASLFSDATQVVIMRSDENVVLSLQNNYQGPPEDFAMVVPVPAILQKENVKTLNKDLFDKIDQLTAPRLVEYWEYDPCEEMESMELMANSSEMDNDGGAPPSVQVEAQFTVGEYEIVILSATEAEALETWLVDKEYNIPAHAAPYLQPYVDAGQYFFVARVNSEKVPMVDGNAVLSPLRIHYESNGFGLPVRLGMINSSGTQDLIVYILGDNQRYEVANYPNAFIPTNIHVNESVKENFGSFYRTLFAMTLDRSPGAVITEYSWDASTCDPCPGPALDQEDFLTLGADVLSNEGADVHWVITRLHARYEKDTMIGDLVFTEAIPVVGGREHYIDEGILEPGAREDTINNFQGRYIIRHDWDGAVTCIEPIYQQWAGPDGSMDPGAPQTALSPNTEGTSVTETPPASDNLSDYIAEPIPELGVEPTTDEPPTDPGDSESDGSFCASSRVPAAGSGMALLLILFAASTWRRRSRQS